MEKRKDFSKLWHDNEWVDNKFGDTEIFNYSDVDSLRLFNETHPAVMQTLIASFNWHFELKKNKNNRSLKFRILHNIETITGVRLFEYKNYKIL